MVDWDKKIPEKPKATPVAQIVKGTPSIESCIVKDWMENEHETIFLFGPTKMGKTWAYMGMIKEALNNGGHIFIVNTDDGVVRTLKKYFQKEEMRKKILDNTTFYYVGNLDMIYPIMDDINAKCKPNDLIAIDLISEITWEMPQAKFVEDASGGDPVNYIIKAQQDNKKFGLLEGTKWQYVKKIEGSIRKGLVIRPRCNIIGVATEKDIEIEKAMSKKEHHKFDITGAKPGGSKELPYDFNSFVYINALPNGKRFFQVLGDRGNDINGAQRFEFEKNFYKKFKEVVGR